MHKDILLFCACDQAKQAIDKTYGAPLIWVVPLGVKKTLKSFGIRGEILELVSLKNYRSKNFKKIA